MIKIIENTDNKLLLDVNGKEVFLREKTDGVLSVSVDNGLLYILPVGNNSCELNVRDYNKRI